MPIRSNNIFSSISHQYYLTPELNQRINLIRHLIQNSEQLLLILAEAGSGKTALLNQLKQIAEDKEEHWWLYTLKSSPALSEESLLSVILTAFNVRQDGKSTEVLKTSLRNHIAATRYNGQLPILFVDNAHKLPLSSLKTIVNLAMDGEPLTRMRVILFCEPQITSILATPEFEIVQQNMTHTLDIPAFSDSQVRDYLQFCLQDTKYQHSHPFTTEAIKKIYTESAGIPAEINLYAGQVLQQFSEQRYRHDYSHSLPYKKLLWGIPILLAIIGISLFFYFQYPNIFQDNILEEFGINQPDYSNYKPIESPQIEEKFINSDFIIPDLPNYVEEKSNTSLIGELELSAELNIPQAKIKTNLWLLQQSPTSYTLQILGVHKQTTLNQFIEENQLTQVAIFKTIYHGKDWYVLVHGVYPTRALAETALNELPTILQKNTPWIRSLGGIQKLISP
ncbi:MAG: AAA family ATPase [Thiomargarita sp.]|nr:AAA family ATPase [Thiomargarita sp.]